MTAFNLASLRVKDVVTFAKGKPPAAQPYFGKDAEIYLTPEYLRGGVGTEPIKAHKNAARVRGGETIVLWDGSNAGEVFKAKAGVLSSTMVELQPDASFIADYFYYAMKGWEAYLKGQTSGSGIPHVDKEVIGKLDLLAFSKSEQSKIAEVLVAVDQAIEQTEALIAKQQRIKTGLMQDLLTRGIDEHGQLRTEQTHAFKDSLLGRIPVEWEVDSLDKLTSEIVDCPHTTPHFLPSGVLVARTFNLKDGQFVGVRSYVSEAEYESRISRLEPNAGDVIFTREAPVGEAFVVPPKMKICLGQRTMQVRCKQLCLLPEFFVEFVYSNETRIRFDQMVGGTTNPHLNVSDVRSLLLRVPSIHEQKLIVEKIGAVRDVIKQSLSQKEKLRVLKTALMQDLLTGRKRVTDLLEPVAA